jgi:hypothetical protein
MRGKIGWRENEAGPWRLVERLQRRMYSGPAHYSRGLGHADSGEQIAEGFHTSIGGLTLFPGINYLLLN